MRGIDINDLYRFTGGDLFIMDFILQNIESAEDFNKKINRREEIYEKVIETYFEPFEGSCKGVLKIASLAQFDIGIHPDYRDHILGEIKDECQKRILRDLVVAADHPSRCFFLHSSLAELICRAAAYKIGANFERIVVENAWEYLKFLWKNKESESTTDEFNQDLAFFIFGKLQLSIEESEINEIKAVFLGESEVFNHIEENFDLIYPNVIGGILLFLNSKVPLHKKYLNILNRKIEDGSYINVLISSRNIAIGQFLYFIEDSYPDLFAQLKHQFNTEKIKQLCEKGDFPSFLFLLSRFFKKEDKEKWYESIDHLDGQDIDKIIEKTKTKNRSIGTIHLGFRDLEKKDLLDKLEKKIGVSNYLNLIENNGTFVELINFIRYSTDVMANALIESLSEEYVSRIIGKTISENRSIGTINLGFRDLEKKDLLDKLEKKIGAFNYIKLIENNGTFVELVRFIQYSTDMMANALIESLSKEYVSRIIGKTISGNRSIGTINLGFRDLEKKDLLDKLEKKSGAFNYLKLIENNGTFVELVRFIGNSTNVMSNALVECLNKKLVEKLINKTTEEKRSVKGLYWEFKRLMRLCGGSEDKFEEKIGMNNIIRLLIPNGEFGTFVHVLDEISSDQKKKFIKAFHSLNEDEMDNYILRGHFANLCYAMVKYPESPIFHCKYRIEKKFTLVKKLIKKSDYKSLNVGIGHLNNYFINEEFKQFLIDQVVKYVESIEYTKIEFKSNSEKINFLSILNRLEKLEENTIRKILSTINEQEFLKEQDFFSTLGLLQHILAIYDVDLRFRQNILILSNSDAIVKIMARENLLNIFLHLWNTYALFRTENPGNFSQWLNPQIVNVVFEKIAKNKKVKPENEESGHLMMLIGLIDYLSIAPERIQGIFPYGYPVISNNSFLIQKIKKHTFIPGFFYLKGIEFFIKKPVFSNTWKQLTPKIDSYKDKTKALQEVLEEFKKRISTSDKVKCRETRRKIKR